jgi:hypothetical protein
MMDRSANRIFLFDMNPRNDVMLEEPGKMETSRTP